MDNECPHPAAPDEIRLARSRELGRTLPFTSSLALQPSGAMASNRRSASHKASGDNPSTARSRSELSCQEPPSTREPKGITRRAPNCSPSITAHCLATARASCRRLSSSPGVDSRFSFAGELHLVDAMSDLSVSAPWPAHRLPGLWFNYTSTAP